MRRPHRACATTIVAEDRAVHPQQGIRDHQLTQPSPHTARSKILMERDHQNLDDSLLIPWRRQHGMAENRQSPAIRLTR